MAVAAVPAPAAVQQQTTPPPVTASEPTMLQKITERIDPAQIQRLENTVFGFSTAAKATAIFFSAAAFVGFVGTAVLAAHLIIPVAVGAFALLAGTAFVCRLFQSVAHIAQNSLDESKEIQSYQMRLRTPQDVRNSLILKGIQWNTIQGIQNESDLLRLTPLIALHDKIEADIAHQERTGQEKVYEANRLALELGHAEVDCSNCIDLTKKAVDYAIRRVEANEAESNALSKKIEAGFINALIRRPNYTGTIDQFGCDFSYPPSNNPASYAFVFKVRNLSMITTQELNSMRVAQLGLRFAEAMA